MKKKILALLLVVVLIVAMVPTTAFAASSKHTVCGYGQSEPCKCGEWHFGEHPDADPVDHICDVCGRGPINWMTHCDVEDYVYDANQHWVTCAEHPLPEEFLNKEAHDFTNGDTCVCGYTKPACEHSWVDGVCELCGEPCAHNWKHVVQKKYMVSAPTCTEHGVFYKSCATCGIASTATFIGNGTKLGNKLGHDMIDVAAKAPNCVADGHNAHKACQREGCDYTEGKEIKPADPENGHKWQHKVAKEYMVSAPTCTEHGVFYKSCKYCGIADTKTTFIGSGHGLGNKKGHDMSVDVAAVAATCTTDGNTAGKKCSRCTETEGVEVIKAQGHKYVDGKCACGEFEPHNCMNNAAWVVTTKATCTEDGVETYQCTICGKSPYISYTATRAIIAGGHKFEDHKCTVCGATEEHKCMDNAAWVVTTKATCTENGVETLKCTICGANPYIREMTREIIAGGHKFEDHKCTVCGATEEHKCMDNVTWKITKAPTCEEEGVETAVCGICGANPYIREVSRPVAAKGHDFKDNKCTACGEYVEHKCMDNATWKITKAPTCEEEGVETAVCGICGANPYIREVSRPVAAKGHDFKDNKCTACGEYVEHKCMDNATWKITKAPTCEEEGVETVVCGICGANPYIREVSRPVAKIDHNYIVDEQYAPTCDKAGLEWHKCDVCGDFKEVEIPATGHKFTKQDVTEATCTETGLIQPYCEICGAKSPLSAQTPALGHDVKDGACTRCDYVEPTKPTEPEETTKPSEPEETTKPTEPEATTKPTEPEATTKPTEPEATTKPTEKPTEAPTEAPTTKPAETTKPADPALDNVPKTGDNTGMILATMTTIALLSAMAFVFGKKRSVR